MAQAERALRSWQQVAAAPGPSCKQHTGACIGTFAPCCYSKVYPEIVYAWPARNKMGTDRRQGVMGGGRSTSGVGNDAMPKEGRHKDDVAGVKNMS